MSRRLYLGRLPPNATRADIEDHFKGYGRIADVRLMGNFGFVEFDSERDADEVSREFNGRSFMGEALIVEPSRDTRRRDFYDGGARPPPRSFAPRRGVRVNVLGVPGSTSWQDLKDYGRIGSSAVIFADLDRNNPGTGILEYATMGEAEDAVARLAGVDLNGTPVKVELGGEAPGRDYPPRDSDRRGPPLRDYDRPRYDDRGSYGRERSPPRRDYDRYDNGPRAGGYERARSPPRRRDDERNGDRRDDRHRAGY